MLNFPFLLDGVHHLFVGGLKTGKLWGLGHGRTNGVGGLEEAEAQLRFGQLVEQLLEHVHGEPLVDLLVERKLAQINVGVPNLRTHS